ncbi:MAG: VCBS repeat-containing protein [Pseudomonadota bacterium]
MKKYYTSITLFLFFLSLMVSGHVAGLASENPNSSFHFNRFVIDNENPVQRAAADIDSDGFPDLFGAVDFESGKQIGLYWYSYPTWMRYPIAEGVNFRGDDLECGDIDNDGDPDLVATINEDGVVLWYENPGPLGDPKKTGWVSHQIGVNGSYVKDVEVNDLDGDGCLDVIVRGEKILNIFKQSKTGTWTALSMPIHKKEGMDVGDLDNDGDLDIILNGYWLETPSDMLTGAWNEHPIDRKWYEQDTGQWQDNCSNVVIVDMDHDGRMDVLLCHSEKEGWPISWYSSLSPKEGPWIEHIVTQSFNYCETLEAADMNIDGRVDIVAGEMKKSDMFGDLTIFYQSKVDATWRAEVIANRIGIYDGLVADIGNDGDYDIVGPQDYNKAPTYWWENKTNDEQFWKYHSVDESRSESQFGKMGIVFFDVNKDGWQDIIAGSIIYVNPKGNLTEKWQQVKLPESIDIYFALNSNHDNGTDLIGIGGNQIYLLKLDAAGVYWSSHTIGKVPQGRTQGYTMAQIIPGGKPELIFTRAHYLYYLVIPDDNAIDTLWQMVMVSDHNEEEGVAAGDIDRDGDIDLAAVAGDGHHVIWLENPGDGSSNWPQYIIGLSSQWTDRIAVTDVNGDGRLDIIATQETQDWEFNANIFWYEAPESPKMSTLWKVLARLPYANYIIPYWKCHTVATLRSVNSMDIGDIDNDGEIDIIAAEHTDQKSSTCAPDNLTVAYHKIRNGQQWLPYVVERGPHASHLGARLIDIDNDGDLDIVSICWKQYKFLHLWENQLIH